MQNTPPPPPQMSQGSSTSGLGAFLKKRRLRLPTWAWILIALVVIIGISTSSSEETNSADSSEARVTTTTRSYRFKQSKDPLENLLYLAEQANPSLDGWEKISKVFTDDDMVFDDIRLDVASDVNYQDENDASSMIDVALAIQAKAQSPVQIDIRTDVRHSETQPDGSITEEKIRREWIEVTGDSTGASVTIDVYGYLPAEETLLNSLRDALAARYPDALVKITDTSSFDS